MKPVFRIFSDEFQMSLTLCSMVSLLLGIAMAAAPDASRQVLCMLFGAGAAAYGLMRLIPHLPTGRERPLPPLTGIGALALGVIALLQPPLVMNFLFAALGVFVCLLACGGIRRSLQLRASGFVRWPVLLGVSLAAFVLALSVMLFPGFYGDMLMTAAGALMIVQSVSDLAGIHLLARQKNT